MPLSQLPLALIILVIGLLSAVAQDGVSADAEGASPVQMAGKAVIIEVGEYAFVLEEQRDFLANAVKDANESGAAAVVLDLQCRGGFASEARRFMERLSESKIPSIAWVDGEAAGAAAFVSLATDHVFFKTPESRVGGEAQEIEWRGAKERLPARMTDLRYWDIEKDLTALLAERAVPAEVVAGLADPSEEVRIGDRKYADAGDVLSIDENAGAELGLVDGVAADVESLLKAVGMSSAGVVNLASPPVQIREKTDEKAAGLAEPEPAVEVAVETEGIKTGNGDEVSAEEVSDNDRAFGQTRMDSYEGKVVVIEVSEETLMRQTKFDFMQRIIEKADKEGAEAIIFDMDSPGGALWQTMGQMLTVLQNLKVPTYTFINPRAISAGSMIAVSSDYIYMHPPSAIGSSAPVSGTGQDIAGTMYEKVIRAFLAAAKDVVNIKGRDYEMVRAFIEVEHPYSASIPVVAANGALSSKVIVEVSDTQLLALGSSEATEIVDGKPLLAEGTARSIDELVEKAGLKGEIVRSKPLGFESLADLLVKIAPWLMLFGIAGAYLEFKAPGFGVPGFIAVICFGLFFFGHQAAGFLAGYEAIGIFVLGVLFVILEIFVFPGLLIFGALGIMMILGSLIYAMIDPVDFGWMGELNFSNLASVLLSPALNLVIALVGASILILLAIRYLPSTPVMRWLGLNKGLGQGTGLHLAGEAGVLAESGGEGGISGLVGQTGKTETDCRPAGAARIAGERLDVVSSGEFLTRGSAVRVVAHEGSRIVVEEI